jgi:hypothetical protein
MYKRMDIIILVLKTKLTITTIIIIIIIERYNEILIEGYGKDEILQFAYKIVFIN